jgi:DNA-binding XRE family transcriptional regulator
MARQTSEKPLTPKQLKAARLQASGLNQRQTAEAVGVTRRAVEQWNSRKGYRDAVTSFMGTVSFSSKTAQLPLPEPVTCSNGIAPECPSDLLPSALRAIQDCLDGEHRMGDKLKAASMVLTMLGLNQDMNTHIAGLRAYGLNVIHDRDGRFVLIDERFTDNPE